MKTLPTLLLSLCSVLIAGRSQAQFIPDENLRYELNLYIEGLVDENGYLTQSNPYIYNLGIPVTWSPCDLTGLEHFSTASFSLSFSEGVEITAFPGFPTMVGESTGVQLYNYPGTSLPAFPANLSGINIVSPVQLQEWAVAGPPEDPILHLIIQDLTNASEWPSPLEHVRSVNIPDGSKNTMPFIGPGVEILYVANMPQVTAFPNIGPDLHLLDIALCDQITTGWTTPQSANGLFLRINAMYGLVDLSTFPSGVDSLELWGTPLLQNVGMQEGLTWLSINQGPLASLSLPEGLLSLTVANVADWCFPVLPASLEHLQCYYVGAPPCFPNQPPLLAPLPLCTAVNQWGCPATSSAVVGYAYVDVNGNMQADGNEPPMIGATVLAQPTGHMVSTDEFGNYVIPLPEGEHTITITAPSALLDVISPIQHTVALGGPPDVVEGVDFAFTSSEGFSWDRQAHISSSGPPRPGFERTLHVHWETFGIYTDPSDLTVSVILDTNETFIASSVPFTSMDEHVLTWQISADACCSGSLWVTVGLPANVELGTQLSDSVIIGPSDGDPYPDNNSELLADNIVVGSYDPNDKRAFPALLTPGQVASDTVIEYLVRFQNTGTYEAERVVITDTLSSDLRWNTFRYIQSSHDCVWSMQNGVLLFWFDGIHLPDSNANEPESHGFVRFSIHPSTQLMAGQSIVNVANIYFDFNAPVITDPCIVQIEQPVGIARSTDERLHVFPQPTSGPLNIMLPAGPHLVEILAVDGRRMITSTLPGGPGQLDVSALPAGTYSLRCVGPNGSLHWSRFVKHN